MCKHMMRKQRVNEDLYEDIFQESLIVLYENLQKRDFQFTAKVSTYLYKVCRIKALESGRKKNKAEVVMPSATSDDRDEERHFQSAEHFDLYAEFENELPSGEELYQAIVALGSPCKEILFMFYYHKTRIKEVMEEQGYPNDNATRQAKDRCVKRLKNKYLG